MKIIDSVSSLSKLESFRGAHSRHDSLVQLPNRRYKISNVTSDTPFNAPISERRIDNSLAPASFRELLAGIAVNLKDDTPRQSATVLTPSHFYRTDEMFRFIEKEMQTTHSKYLEQEEMAA